MKMFTSIEKAAEELGIDARQVIWLCQNGHLQEFRDGTTIVLKSEQVSILADIFREEGLPEKLPAPESLPSLEQENAGFTERIKKALFG